MHGLFHNLPSWLDFLGQYRYTLLFLLGAFEGGNTTVLAGVLVATGDLAPLPTFSLLAVGETINGALWYYAGRHWGSRLMNWYVGKSALKRTVVDAITHHFNRFSAAIILTAKMTFSLTNLTLALTGTLGYAQRRFHLWNFLGSVGWVGMLMVIGYFFGAQSLHLLRYVRGASYVFIVIVLALAAAYLVSVLSHSVLDRLLDRIFGRSGRTSSTD